MTKKKEAETSESKEVVSWSARMASDAKQVAEQETSSINNISIKNGIMKVNGDVVPNSTMDVVVVAHVTERRYYKGAYNADKIVSPTCYSQSVDGLMMIPAENVPDVLSESCITCPMDQFGSEPTRGKGKACKESRKLAVIPAAALDDPASIANVEIGIISIPITSVKSFWAPYVKGLQAGHSRPPWGVITTMTASPDDRKMLKVEFALKGLISDDALGAIHDRIEKVEEFLLQGYQYETERQEADDATKKF